MTPYPGVSDRPDCSSVADADFSGNFTYVFARHARLRKDDLAHCAAEIGRRRIPLEFTYKGISYASQSVARGLYNFHFPPFLLTDSSGRIQHSGLSAPVRTCLVGG